MLSDSQVEKIALFYYFTYLDESKAQTATVQTLKKIISLLPGKVSTEEIFFLEFIKQTHRFVEQFNSSENTNYLSVVSSHVDLPEGSNWGPWFEYRRVGPQQEFFSVLYHQILKIPVNTIAQGLDVSHG